MPTTSQWLAFVIASALFIQVPGPSLLFTIGRALTVGRRDALLSVVGNALGVTTQVFLVAVGLGAVVAASAQAYVVLKVAGAAYVVWLGIQAIRHRADARAALGAVDQLAVARASARRSLRIGFTVGLTNPKTIVFFVAFLPQFVNEPAGHTGMQIALLGAVFGAMAVCSDSAWALAASKARDWFARRPQRLDRLGVAGGVMMIGLGATMAASE
ncbi:LysE family transporter [Nocardioides sp. LMS-CY]|uniref:Threonine/homoserine/homoserine lactone efflux protein n=1 Tax=Nocardioides soli TaxID=1036020 RepID=A0A7W4Z3R5_9ACTN|nr:LysE family translocator [Nocardioides sp. LMS-CY]MBB3045378.1 threonine/homoserine/homoserine lactone efflux protein [Nocardioides soli]QWF22102.1 LysE family transporter [Nocardioides sp. LMS-CY]